MQPVERDLGTAGFDPTRAGGPVAVELGDKVAPHGRHPLDRLDVLGREGRPFDDPEPVGVPATEKVTTRPSSRLVVTVRRCGS